MKHTPAVKMIYPKKYLILWSIPKRNLVLTNLAIIEKATNKPLNNGINSGCPNYFDRFFDVDYYMIGPIWVMKPMKNNIMFIYTLYLFAAINATFFTFSSINYSVA